jgi:cellobiose phosphorylase
LQGRGDRAVELWNLINPVYHATTVEEVQHYKVEPYVACADVYGAPPHTGRGGWTWYTGSAGWMYRLLIETLLGAHLEGDHLRLAPCLPRTWTTYKLHYRFRQTVYHITITRAAAGAAAGPVLSLDGRKISGTRLPLCDDRNEHFAELTVP